MLHTVEFTNVTILGYLGYQCSFITVLAFATWLLLFLVAMVTRTRHICFAQRTFLKLFVVCLIRCHILKASHTFTSRSVKVLWIHWKFTLLLHALICVSLLVKELVGCGVDDRRWGCMSSPFSSWSSWKIVRKVMPPENTTTERFLISCNL